MPPVINVGANNKETPALIANKIVPITIFSREFKYYDINFPGDAVVFRDKVILFKLDPRNPSAILISGKHISKNYRDPTGLVF